VSDAASIGIIFLGFSERSAVTEDRGLTRINLIGLTHFVPCLIFPAFVPGGSFVFAFSRSALQRRLNLELHSPSGAVTWTGTLAAELLAPDESPAARTSEHNHEQTLERIAESHHLLLPPDDTEWIPFILPIRPSDVIAFDPGEYRFFAKEEEKLVPIGTVVFLPVTVPPLSEDRKRAIRSSPTAAKTLRAEFGCKGCDSKLRLYCGLERSKKEEQAGYQWYADLPDRFQCACGKTNISCEFLRSNLHGLLGARARGVTLMSTISLYEGNALHDLTERFAATLEAEREEEAIQKFVEANLLALAPFSPERIFFKKPILTRHVTDIAILNHRRELTLIELERASATLFRGSDDAIAAPLEHALGQVDDWLVASERNMLGVLDAFELKMEEVSSVSGLAIAGRDRDCSERQLLKLQWMSWPRKRVWTYDDWLRSLASLANQLSTA
jgi:Domain of unknown function (DUF4263)